MTARIAITVDLGPSAPLEEVIKVVRSVNDVCEFAVSLDRQSALNRATQASRGNFRFSDASDTPATGVVYDVINILREQSPFPDKEFADRQGYWTNVERAVFAGAAINFITSRNSTAEANYLLQARSSGDLASIRVQSIRYENPIELILTGVAWGSGALLVGAPTIFGLMRMIRDWGPKREKARADSQKTRAEAAESEANAERIRSATDCKERLFNYLLEQTSRQETTLTPQQISDSLSQDAVASVYELTQHPVSSERLPDSEQDEAS